MQCLRYLLVILALAVPLLAFSQSNLQSPDNPDVSREAALRVYLDCSRCDISYVITEVTFVNFVREPRDAQVHIISTSQPTASRGTEYALEFIGRQNFTGKNDTLKYISRQEDTESVVREGIARTLRLGLARYAAATPVAEYLDLTHDQRAAPTAVVDKWDSWVFRLSGNTSLTGEESRNTIGINGSISASRITEAFKIRLSLNGNYNERNYYDDRNDEWDKYITRSESFSSQVVKSLTDHWSAGIWFSGNSTTYRNIERELSLSPAVEYNLFPYSESTRRELRFVYRIGGSDVVYVDTTIYNQIAETLFSHSLDINLQVTEKWGSARIGLEASHYFHDLDLNRLSLDGNLSLRLFRGLSLTLSGGVDMIHDQLALAKGGATPEEILLRTRELETAWEYSARIGLSYTFGSIYSNVVNPRFGNGY